jgi:hypothetical protein
MKIAMMSWELPESIAIECYIEIDVTHGEFLNVT